MFLAKPPNPSLAFSVPVSKGAVGGLGNKRVRESSPFLFRSAGTKLATAIREPEGLENIHVEFPRFPFTQPEGLRSGGRKQAVTNRGVKRSPSVLPYTFGAPVSGGEGFRRTVIESDSFTQPGPLGVAGSL